MENLNTQIKERGPVPPMNPFQCFQKALSNTMMSSAGEKWHALTEEQKQKYKAMAQLDKQRYEVEVELQNLTQVTEMGLAKEKIRQDQGFGEQMTPIMSQQTTPIPTKKTANKADD